MSVLAWTAIRAFGKLQCSVKRNPDARHTFFLFLKRWLSVLRSQNSSTSQNCYVFLSVDQVRNLNSAIESLQNGALSHPSLSITPPPRPQGPAAAKVDRKQQRKQEGAIELEELLPWLIEQGYCLIFTNGSSQT